MEFTHILAGAAVFFMAVNIILAYILVFLERRDPTTIWAWLLVLLFLPGLGFVLYLFLGQDLRKKRLFSAKEETDLEKTAHQQEVLLEKGKTPFDNPVVEKYMDLIHLHLHTARTPFTQNNRIQLLINGSEKFPLLLERLKNAKDHIHMEYYIIRDDGIGRLVRDVLAQKAREGVKVRLLYDGMGCIALPNKYLKPLLDAGAQVAEFYPPFLPHINVRVNYRNHRKITVIDGKTAFTGGLNLGDEYLGLCSKYGFWRDTHIMLEGSAVDTLQLRFMMDWQFASGQKLPMAHRYFPQKQDAGKVGVQMVSSGPDSRWAAIRQGYLKMISKAEKNVYIQTPYFVPDDSIIEALKVAALGGVDVRIMIPCKPDHPFVYWASTSFISELLDTGAKAYTYTNGFLHCKTLTVDGQISSVGTANMDIRSFKMNFEINAFIYDPAITQCLEKNFMEDLQSCREITLESYSKRPARMRVNESISRLLSPLL